MEFSKKLIDEFKNVCKEENNKEINDSEANNALSDLAGFFSILAEIDHKDKLKKKRLKNEVNGFPVDGNYNCLVCGRCINPDNGWYDWYGPMCIFCHKAYKNGVIPSFVCENRDSYYDSYYLKEDFDIHYQSIKKMVRLGELKARIVFNEKDKPYEYIFLKKENPQLIDPDRDSPAMRSYKKHRNKVLDNRIRIEKAKIRAPFKVK